jgi:fructan beta-fructosidase
VSTDLVHWTHLPIALSPDDLGEIYSGSAVVDVEDSSGFFGGRPGMVAIFTHNNQRQPPLGPQVQSLAYSSDRGRTWTTYAQNPVIPNPDVANFRDPKVIWHPGTAHWVLVLACHDRVHFYRSRDLKAWTFASAFGAGQGAPIVPWECPDLFELPVAGSPARRKWVLQVSVHPRQDLASSIPDCKDMQYFIGEFDGLTFKNDNSSTTVLWTDYGRDNYAEVSWSNILPTDGRRIWIGWMDNWDYARAVPTGSWQGAMTLPRQVALREGPKGIQITQTPVAELQALRAGVSHWSNQAITPDVPLLTPLPSGGLEIQATFQLGSATAFGLNLRTAVADHTLIEYDSEQQMLFVDRRQSGETSFHPTFPGRPGGPLAPSNGTVFLHIFVDTCSVEVFGNDGVAVITSLIFPRNAIEQLEVYAVSGAVQLTSMDVYHLDPADD